MYTYTSATISPVVYNSIYASLTGFDDNLDATLRSEVWTGLNQEAYNIMVTADPTPL